MFLEDVSRKIVVKRDMTAAIYTKFRQSTKSKHLIEFEVFHFLMPLSFQQFWMMKSGGEHCPKIINHHLFYCHSEIFINSWPKKCLLKLEEHLPCSLRKDYILEVKSILLTAPEDVFWRERHVTSTKSMPDRIGKKTQQVHQLFFSNLSKSVGWLPGGFNLFEKYWSNWIISPGRAVEKKPPPSWLQFLQISFLVKKTRKRLL